MALRENLNCSDWIGQRLLAFIQAKMANDKSNEGINVSAVANMFGFIECTESYRQIINRLFTFASTCHSQPY